MASESESWFSSLRDSTLESTGVQMELDAGVRRMAQGGTSVIRNRNRKLEKHGVFLAILFINQAQQ